MCRWSALQTGDEVLIPLNAYGPNAEGELSPPGITHQFYDPLDVADLARRIGDRIAPGVWLEVPGSVSMESWICPRWWPSAARAVSRPRLTTPGRGPGVPAFDAGVDISVHASPSTPAGWRRVDGSVITRAMPAARAAPLTHMRLAGASSQRCRGHHPGVCCPAWRWRYRAHDQAAHQLPGWLQARAGRRCRTRRLKARRISSCAVRASGQAWLAAGLFSILDARYKMARRDASCHAPHPRTPLLA